MKNNPPLKNYILIWRKVVLDFMDFLLAKEIKSKRAVKSDYKKRILKVSVWNDSDIEFMMQNQQKLN